MTTSNAIVSKPAAIFEGTLSSIRERHLMEDLEELQLLGRGGYASVHLCRRKGSSELYGTRLQCTRLSMTSLLLLTRSDWSGVYILHVTALKRIPRSKLVSQQQQDRVATERQILESVASPFLCRSHAAFETEEEVAFLLEYIEGRALYECIWKYKDSGKFPEPLARFFAAQIVLALRRLHARGYIHRDLKSGNILVDQFGFAKVIDFGLSKKVGAVHQAGLEGSEDKEEISDRTQSMCGTHYVMAPEVFFREPYGFAIDWWSLGVVIHEMVAGRPPWEYQCPAGCSMDEFFQRIKRTASSPFQNSEQQSTEPLSSELQSLIGQLLAVNAHDRLGRNGAAEVMRHPWFKEVEWELLEAVDTRKAELTVPYDPQTDYNSARVRVAPPHVGGSISSAESIDPEDDAKYFADF